MQVDSTQKNQDWNEQLRSERVKHNWSLADLAGQLQCDPKTVGRWEQGQSYPSPYFRRKLAELLDLKFSEQAPTSPTPAPATFAREDWDEAPYIEHFYGREQDLARLQRWIKDKTNRVVAITGIGGIGKTTFAIRAARQASSDFDRVWWRSLQNAPTVEQTITSCLHFLLGTQQREIPQQLDEQLPLLIETLRKQRCLLILDNIESLLQPNQSAGQFLPTHTGYGQLLRTLSEVQHRSCLVLTSREKPQEIAHMEGESSPVHSFSLSGLETAPCRDILRDRQLHGTDENWTVLAWLYRGNPLALKLIAEPIREVFQGDLASFLSQEASVFGDVHTLLEQQFARLSPLELELIYWLAIEREPTSIATLQEDILHPLGKRSAPQALDSLRRRSLVEIDRDGYFTLHPVILEDATTRLIAEITQEIDLGEISLFSTHALLKSGARDYIRQAQISFILAPVAEQLLQTAGRNEIERKARTLLIRLREVQKPDYAAGNLLNLLLYLQYDLRGYDFSRLYVRQAYLQNMSLPEVSFAHATFANVVFTQTFSILQCVVVSSDGQLLVAGTTTGEIWFWRFNDLTPLGTCPGHVDGIRALALNSDGSLLASGGEDERVYIWDVSTRTLRYSLEGHTNMVRTLAWSPTGTLLASGSEDQSIRLWETTTGECLHILRGHTRRVRAVTFAGGGERLISGSEDLTIRTWNTVSGQLLSTHQNGTSHVMTLAFDATRQVLISGHEDGRARIWRGEDMQLVNTLQGHSERIWSLAIDPAAQWLASASEDHSICLWNLETLEFARVLQGHSNRIWSVAFAPDAHSLVSVSDDETLRVWETASGECRQTLRGSITLMKALAFSPDGKQLASGSEDQSIFLWDVQDGRYLKALRGHTRRIRAVAYSNDNLTIASGSEDESIKLWNAQTGKCLRTLHGHTHLVRAVVFSPDGHHLASAGFDGTIRLWDTQSGQSLKVWSGQQGRIWSLAFSPDGNYLASAGEDYTVRTWTLPNGHAGQILTGHLHHVWGVAFSPDGGMLVSGSDDRTVRLWESATGRCLRIFEGHEHWVRAVAFSPDGQYIASAGHDQVVKLWDVSTGACLQTLTGHKGWIWSVAFSPDGQTLASCGDDSTVQLWDTTTERYTSILRTAGPYEHMNITGARGLSPAQNASLKFLGAIEEE